MYEAVSETFKDPTADPRLEPVKKGPFDNDNELPSKSVKLSLFSSDKLIEFIGNEHWLTFRTIYILDNVEKYSKAQ